MINFATQIMTAATVELATQILGVITVMINVATPNLAAITINLAVSLQPLCMSKTPFVRQFVDQTATSDMTKLTI